MFPEGHGKPVATTLSGKAAPFTNALVVNSKAASDELWKRRGYDQKTPDVTKARLGYRLDREEVAGWVLTRALKLPLLSPSEARCIGKRVGNSLLPKAALGKAIAQHKKHGSSTAALLLQKATLSLAPPPPPKRKRYVVHEEPPPTQPHPEPSPPPPLQPPPSPPTAAMPPPSLPAPCAAESKVDYSRAGDCSVPFFATERHPEIPGYRGRPGGDDVERYWNPALPPCVPSDHRPALLFNSREAAEAAGAAALVERRAPPPPDDEEYGEDDYNPMWDFDEDEYDVACLRHKQKLRRLRESFPEADEEHHTRPCPCGRGALAVWPWVVQTAQLGFCECWMACWERTCWRSEWIAAGAPDLAW